MQQARQQETPFSPVEEIVDELRNGRMVILMDDEDRENEGDLIIAAGKVRPEDINFMAKHGRGLICLALTRERCQHLRLPLMVNDNSAPLGTNFTVSIEAARGVTTGISAADRATTVRAAVAPDARPSDLVQPGHIFPLMAQPGGVLIRAGHTEAAVDLARMAGLEAAGVICEILNEDGSMARRPELETFGRSHGLKLGTIADLIRYRLENEATVERVSECDFATSFGDFRLAAFRDRIDGRTHLALYRGTIRRDQPVLVRVHVDNGMYDRFAEFRPGYVWPVDASLERISGAGAGVIVLLDYRETGEQLLERVAQLERTDKSEQTVPPVPAEDLRMVGIGAQILADLGVGKMRVLGPERRIHNLSGFGLDVVEYLPER